MSIQELFRFRKNKIIELYIFKFHDIITWDVNAESVNEIWLNYVIFQQKKFHQKILQKLRPENQFQALLHLQRIKHNY